MFLQRNSRKILTRLAAIAATILLSLALVFTALRAEEPSSPLLWKIERGASTLYLFGTFHLLTADVVWLDERITSALESADELVLEIAAEQTDASLVTRLVREKGMYDTADGLQRVLSAETYDDLVKQAGAVGIPAQFIGRLRPWYASIMLSIQYAQVQGFRPEFGVEATLTALAKAHNTPVLGLETTEQQLSMLAGHSNRVQVLMLEDTLAQLEDLPRLLDDMTRAWVTGDEDGIADLIIGGASEIPELYEAAILQRNRNWIPFLEARLQKPGTYLVAVGVGHLVGDDSVVTLMREEGYRVRPVK